MGVIYRYKEREMLLSSAIYMNKRMKKVASGDNGRGKMGLKRIQNTARYIYIIHACT